MSFFARLIRMKALVFCFCLLVISLQFVKQGFHTPVTDEFGYLKIADDLTTYGVFTNGGFNANGKETAESGAFFSPIYPVFLSLTSRISQSSVEAVSCFAKRLETCQAEDMLPVVVAQIIIAALSGVLIFHTVLMLFENRAVAWLVLVLVLVDKTHVEYASHFLTENAAFFLFYLFGFLLVYALKNRNIINWGYVGAVLALAALARPTYYYLLFFLPFLIFAFEKVKHQLSSADALKSAMVFFVSGYVVLLPWMLRNYVYFDEFVLTNGYAGYILVQRVAYNMMSWGEWVAAFVYWLPDFGDSLAASLFPEEFYRKLSWYDPESYYMIGNRGFRAEMLEAAGGRDEMFGFLLKNHIIGDLFQHVMVTFPLALRGMWTGKYIGLVGFIGLIPVILMMAKQSKAFEFMMYLFPGYFILGLNAFVSVNVVRYNEPLIVIFASVVAFLLVRGYGKVRNKIKRADNGLS